ncbi:tautomerase family protein [Actinomadura rupiterrae]|uniref:tautomerase family protein n=1 Tax=Actinomadura rupiterrae TaxID=559627 RepID=UPI0020A54C66|nr:tautomerase family protein [Actinomadura rupiterrae]MCP2339321.1 phenylpyruvate tautomerase PptA (4-oxalocrotonate tautomerase family) [Actinomadura rupiterrae]
MPLVQVSLRRGKSAEYHQALFDGVYRAMRETFDVPEDDRFMTITEHDASTFDVSPTYCGVERSDEAVIIRITANNTRDLAQKKAFYLRIVEHLQANPGVRPEDVFINLVEVPPENWSLGHGIAQYAPQPD